MDGPWELEAENWVRWARTPGHDAYWDYAPVFFDEMVPAEGRLTLELGCGEGRVVRDLTARGHRAVGLDASPTLLAHARGADPSGRYVLADAARVPFADGAFDLVVAYNSLMNIEGMEAAVREAARVLETNGRLCVCVTHPRQRRRRLREPGARRLLRDRRILSRQASLRGHVRTRRLGDHLPRLGVSARGLRTGARGRRVRDRGHPRAAGDRRRGGAGSARTPMARLPAFLFLRAIKR